MVKDKADDVGDSEEKNNLIFSLVGIIILQHALAQVIAKNSPFTRTTEPTPVDVL